MSLFWVIRFSHHQLLEIFCNLSGGDGIILKHHQLSLDDLQTFISLSRISFSHSLAYLRPFWSLHQLLVFWLFPNNYERTLGDLFQVFIGYLECFWRTYEPKWREEDSFKTFIGLLRMILKHPSDYLGFVLVIHQQLTQDLSKLFLSFFFLWFFSNTYPSSFLSIRQLTWDPIQALINSPWTIIFKYPWAYLVCFSAYLCNPFQSLFSFSDYQVDHTV